MRKYTRSHDSNFRPSKDREFRSILKWLIWEPLFCMISSNDSLFQTASTQLQALQVKPEMFIFYATK